MSWLIDAHACSSVHCSTVLPLLDTLGLLQQDLELAAPAVEGTEVSRARIQWKQRFTSSAETRTAHFPKDGHICLGLHVRVSDF